MIVRNNNTFVLDTKNTTYVFRVMETGQLEHMYYGKKIKVEGEGEALREKHSTAPGNTVAYTNENTDFALEDVALEFSGLGKGDIREPFVEIIAADGSSSTDFVFESAEITKGKPEFKDLPGSYDESGEVDHLTVVLKDKNNGYTIELHYYVFEDCDVISRSAKFINTSNESVRLTRMMSMMLDFDKTDFVISSFHGGWIKEMKRVETKLSGGKFVNASYTGSSSSRSNPFVMLSRPETTENYGDAYGFNIVYSGNHYEAVEVSSFDKTRFVSGINPQGFEFVLNAGEEFEAPEAVMTYSANGHDGMSQNMHFFVRSHITRGKWRDVARPVLLNSWEASYFAINESKLLKLAKAGKSVGIELFVMDDGWFGQRNDDKRGLGDWTVNKKKLPHGVKGLCDKVNKLGLDFGIWIEPEMVNVDSDLYRAHPEWAIEIPGKAHSEGRNQRLLDMGNPEVVEYISKAIIDELSTANIAYVKWDWNRIFSDVYSQYLPKDRQGEVFHRYVLGFYKLAANLTNAFPEVLFEGCASGGNRFDLGALCYFPQIWGSDDTDANARLSIQTGYSYGYPMNTVGAHVSGCPNHQTLRITPLETRFNVAAFGVLGYECNLCDMSKEDLAEIKTQVEIYKKYRDVLQFGDFHRGRQGNIYEWTVVSKDKKHAVGMIMQKEVHPNDSYQVFKPVGLDDEKTYKFTGRDMDFSLLRFGDLVNTAGLPIHIKQDGFLHKLAAKFVKQPGEHEEYIASGALLNNAGVKLCQSYCATGYDMANHTTRLFQDYYSRIYFIDEV